MQHLDEGTIHAWLDGALDSAQASEAEAHVAQCASCSAAVAEARGLIAASSRILTALDDVPSGVIPKRAPAIPASLRKPSRRQWRAAPWVSSIAAAALLLAIGINQLQQDSKGAVERVMRASAPLTDTPRAAAQAALAVDTAATAAPISTSIAANASRSNAPVAQRSEPARRDAAMDIAATAPSEGFAARNAKRTAQPETRQTKSVQREQLAAAPTPPAAAPVVASEEVKLETSKSVLVAPPVAPTALGAVVTTGARETAKVEIAETRLVGCYRIERDERRELGDSTRLRRAGEAVAAIAGGAARGRAAPTAAASDRPTQYRAPVLPAIVRLDTTRHPLGFTVRDARSDSTVGSWRAIGQDIARVDLLTAGLFDFALKNRTSCPER